MDTIYKQLIDELNKNCYAKTLTIISDNENIGRKVILHSDSSMDSIDYVSRNIENIVNSSVNDEDREILIPTLINVLTSRTFVKIKDDDSAPTGVPRENRG